MNRESMPLSLLECPPNCQVEARTYVGIFERYLAHISHCIVNTTILHLIAIRQRLNDLVTCIRVISAKEQPPHLAVGRISAPLQKQYNLFFSPSSYQINTVSWCSWLSRMSNSLSVRTHSKNQSNHVVICQNADESS